MNKKLLSLKDFINMPDKDIYETASDFKKILNQMDDFKANSFGLSITALDGVNARVKDPYSDKELDTISFVSNSYLGLNFHPEIKEVIVNAINAYGIGTCAAMPIGGKLTLYTVLEKKIAALHEKDDAILYSSGYVANIGVYQLLFNKSDLVLVDMSVHASVFDGLKNNTNLKMFGHNDMDYLEMILRREQSKYRNITIVVDGVYSQDGDLSPLPDVCKLAEKYNARVFLDDAHGLGVFGKNGKGTASHFGVEDKIDLITGTFSKSIGSIGGYATGKEELISYLKHASRSNTFSVSLPQYIVAGAIRAIDMFTKRPQFIRKLWDNTIYVKGLLAGQGFDIGHSDSPITPVMIRDDKKALLAARHLLKNGIYLVPAMYPAVKTNNSRFRVNITAMHTIEDIDKLCAALLDADKTFNFRP